MINSYHGTGAYMTSTDRWCDLIDERSHGRQELPTTEKSRKSP